MFSSVKGGACMDVRPGDILHMRKAHPCGEFRWLVLRSGMDFRLRCLTCGREVLTPRPNAEKNVKRIERPETTTNGGTQA